MSLFVSNAVAANPFFAEKQNQFGINLGQAFNSYALVFLPEMPVPFNSLELHYSQPATFFRLPARQSVNFIQTLGYGNKYKHNVTEWHWRDYTVQIITIGWDFGILWTDKWYFGSGLSVGVQGKENKRIGTKYLSGFKLFTGWKFADNWRAELTMQHYSNGSTDPANFSYNFYELGVNYSF